MYSLEGNLVGIPGEEAYDGTGFGKEDFPLVSLPCESIFGLVFVHLDDDPEPLVNWIGADLVDVLRRPLGLGEYEVFAVDSDPLAVNLRCCNAALRRRMIHIEKIDLLSSLLLGNSAIPTRFFDGYTGLRVALTAARVIQ